MLFFILILALPSIISSRYHRFQLASRNTQCQCVPVHLCSDTDEAVMYGHGLLEPRIRYRQCLNSDEICCNNPQKKADDTIPSYDDHQPQKSKTPPCGYSTNIVKSRITSNTFTTFGELPWNLIIQQRAEINGKNIYKCGASLIHPKVALTVAHCVIPYSEQPEKLLVRAGEWNVDSYDEPLPFQDNDVEEILIHYDFNPLSLKNDIAIVIMAKDFDLVDNVRVACLATPKEKIIGNACVVSGWGKDGQAGRYSSIMKKIQVPLVSRDFCVEQLRTTKLGPRYVLHKNFICAGGKRNEDSCKGDGGSPLICPLLEDRNRFVQVGIVAWGVGCGSEGIPGIYVNVMPYVEWIEAEMMDRDLDASYFTM